MKVYERFDKTDLILGLALAAVVIFFAMATWGCGASHVPPQSSPQTSVAIYGGDVMASTRKIQSTIIGLEAAGLPKAAIAESLKACAEVFRGGLMLADALTAYQAAVSAATKAAAATDVNAVVTALTDALPAILKPFGQIGGVRQQIADLIAEMVKTLWTIRALVPAPVLVPDPLPLPAFLTLAPAA
jgi:hypothetical protein